MVLSTTNTNNSKRFQVFLFNTNNINMNQLYSLKYF